MPDVTDVGPRQSKYPSKHHASRKESLSDEREKKLINKSMIQPLSKPFDKCLNKEERKKNNAVELRTITKNTLKEVKTFDDLIHLPGPCTEASIINNLRSRFSKKIYQVRESFLIQTWKNLETFPNTANPTPVCHLGLL